MISGNSQRRGLVWSLGCAFFVLAWIGAQPFKVTAQPSGRGVPADTAVFVPPDSTKTPGFDSTAASRVPPKPPLFRDIGAPFGSVAPVQESGGHEFIAKRDLVWDLYSTPFDVVAGRLSGYRLSQGAPALVNGSSRLGAAPDAVSTLFNGRPLRDIGRDAFDMTLYPMEFVERVEILRGARSVLYGSGEALSTVNFAQPRFDVAGSYVRLWYVQGPNNSTGADITYARNVGDRSNLTVGFRRIPSDGEFPNQEVSSWDVRGSFRWNPSDAFTISLTEIYTDLLRGRNGGLTETSGRFPASNAAVVNEVLSEESTRHDLTLAATWYPLYGRMATDSAEGAAGDSITRFDASLYYTNAAHNLLAGDTAAPALVVGQVPVGIERDLLGARLSVALPLVFARLEANGSAELLGSGKLRFEAGGMLELPLADVVTLRGAAKLSKSREREYATVVGDVSIAFSDSLTVFGSLRQSVELSQDAPSNIDYTVADSVHAYAEYFTSFLGEGRLQWHIDGGLLGLGGGVRRATPRVGTNEEDGYTIIAGDLRALIPYRFLRLDLNVLATIAPEQDKRFPLIDAVGDLYAQARLLRGNLDLRVGTSLEFQSSFVGSELDVISGELLSPRDPSRTAKQQFPNWSVYARARIGSAYLRAEMRNILDAEFWSIYRYPVWGRALYLGVTWALID